MKYRDEKVTKQLVAECIMDHPQETCIPKESYLYNYMYRWPLWVEALYNTSFRPLFALSVALLIAQVEFPMIFGRNIINICVRQFLCCRVFAMLSKLTFGIYLYHLFFVWIWYASAIPGSIAGFPTIWQCYMAKVFKIN